MVEAVERVACWGMWAAQCRITLVRAFYASHKSLTVIDHLAAPITLSTLNNINTMSQSNTDINQADLNITEVRSSLCHH